VSRATARPYFGALLLVTALTTSFLSLCSDLFGNRIHSLPECFGDLSSLEYLSLASNELYSLPISMDKLPLVDMFVHPFFQLVWPTIYPMHTLARTATSMETI
jgi:hypothetical protein